MRGMLICAVLVSALALFFGSGLHPIWFVSWLAPLPLLWIAPRISGRAAFFAAMVAWALGTLNMAGFALGAVRMPLPAFLAFDILPGCVVGAALVFYRAGVKRGAVWSACFGFAAICTSVEFIQSLISIHGTYGSVAYTQMDFVPVLQIASITGIWGISFLLFWVPAAVATGQRSLAISAAGLLVVVIAFGLLRMKFTPPPQATINVGLAASDLPQNIYPHSAAEAERLYREYAAMAGQLRAQGATLAVFPERLAVIADSRMPQVDALFEAAGSAHGMEILVGFTRQTPTTLLNEARLYSPEGSVEATYEKHHMLPPFESKMLVGTTRTLLHKPDGKWGITICKDMDFPLLSRQYGNDGVGLLLVPAWDFVTDGWQHDRMALMRGVESGFTIVRAAKQGMLTVSDDRGRVLAQKVTSSAPFATLLATVPVRHDATFYDRFGDWFGWLTVLLAVALITAGSLPRFSRRSRPASRPETPAESATVTPLR